MKAKRNLSNKIYEVALIATIFFTIFNIISLWVTWHKTSNPIGYVSGALEICALLACGFLAFFNEKVAVRKQWFIWVASFILHIVFFVICIVLTITPDKNNTAIPALFTVLLICILIAILFVLLKDRIIIKRKPYTFSQTTVGENGDKEPRNSEEIVQPTIQINVSEQEDNTPKPVFEKPSFVDLPKQQPEELKQEDAKTSEDKEQNSNTGVINL